MFSLLLLSAGLCLEKRVFYRLISGLHSSINIHLCAEYLLDEGWGRSVWGPNVQEFRQRFDTAETKGEGTRRLKNLYFLYLIELRALYKVSSYFERAFVNLYTGNAQEDGATKELLLQVFKEIKRNSASTLKTSPGSWTVSAAVNVDCGENYRLSTSIHQLHNFRLLLEENREDHCSQPEDLDQSALCLPSQASIMSAR
eukprot:superscaffoldBa00005468_g20382